MRNSTRITLPLSVAVAASGIAAPAAKDWPAVGEVSAAVGGELPVHHAERDRGGRGAQHRAAGVEAARLRGVAAGRDGSE